MFNLSNKKIDSEDFFRLLFSNEKISISQETESILNESYAFLAGFSKDKIIYGINTGLGPMAQFKVKEADYINLQMNLIRSHSCGTGSILPEIYIRATLISRLISLLKSYSGVNPQLVKTLADFINSGIYPLIFEHGGVGASGDLVQLAHVALCLFGEGEVIYKGELRATETVLAQEGIEPARIYIREGLAILNGTSAMTGIGLVNIYKTESLINWSLFASASIIEILESYDDLYSSQLNNLKNHSGQSLIAESLRRICSDSGLTQTRYSESETKFKNVNKSKEKVQEYYSIRCVPQILGPIYDTLKNAEKILNEELNSVNDNPVIDKNSSNVYHGGNFHGDYVSFEMDKLKIAVTKLSMLSERRINYLLNNKLNEKLPPFLIIGKPGLNLGLQGLQFTATSTTAENQTLSYPMYLHSIPSNMDNQDIVSMGTNSALLAGKVIENTFQVITIEIIAILQAIDILEIKGKLSTEIRAKYEQLREVFPDSVNDSAVYFQMNTLKEFLVNNNPGFIK